MKKWRRLFILLTGIMMLIMIIGGCSSKKESQKTRPPATENETHEGIRESEVDTSEKIPVLPAHIKLRKAAPPVTETKPEVKEEAEQPVSAKQETPAVPKVEPVKKPEEKSASLLEEHDGLNPLDLYDYEVIEEKEEPYSALSKSERVVYWRVINSLVRNKQDNYKLAKIILSKMKRKFPKASFYNMDINERYYSVNRSIGKVIPYSDQLQESENF